MNKEKAVSMYRVKNMIITRAVFFNLNISMLHIKSINIMSASHNMYKLICKNVLTNKSITFNLITYTKP
jgi:hypothetical protein